MQLKNELEQLRTQAPAAPLQTDPVREGTIFMIL